MIKNISLLKKRKLIFKRSLLSACIGAITSSIAVAGPEGGLVSGGAGSISNSGNTSELLNLLKFANRFRIKIIGIASKSDSILLKASDIKLLLPKVKEADIIGMVPTSSTSISLLLGDCLATTVMYQKKFSKEKFKIFHPGGNIGKSLLLAKDIMVTGKKMPVLKYKRSFKEALKIMNQKKLGIVVILKNKFIKGLVTDGDLRRELQNYEKNQNLNKFLKIP